MNWFLFHCRRTASAGVIWKGGLPMRNTRTLKVVLIVLAFVALAGSIAAGVAMGLREKALAKKAEKAASPELVEKK